MLYFLQDGTHLKIGITKNPDARLATVRTNNGGRCSYLLLMELKNDKEIEGMLHDRLKHCVSPGGNEWFDIPYSTALKHLFALEPFWSLPGAEPELALASPRGPQFSEHEPAFRAWLRDLWYREGGIPPGIPMSTLR